MSERLLVTLDLDDRPKEALWEEGAWALAEALGLTFAKGLPSHQHRSSRGQFSKTPILPTGKLSASERLQARDRAHELVEQELRPRLFQHLEDWEAGHLEPQEWYDRSARDLRYFYRELLYQGKRAAGNPLQVLTPQDKSILKHITEDELTYLAGFRDHLASGGGKMPYPERLELYVHASYEMYWTGFGLGDFSPNRQLRWTYGATEMHCGLHAGGKAEGCSDFVALGWQSAAAFFDLVLSRGFAPRGGKLECSGIRCLCYLSERRLGELAETVQSSPYGPSIAPGAASLPIAEPEPVGLTGMPEPAQSNTGEYGNTPSRAAIIRQNAADEGAGLPKSEVGSHWAVALALLTGLNEYAKREAALRDAAAFLFLNRQELARHVTDPNRLAALLKVRDRTAKWLAQRLQLTPQDAQAVVQAVPEAQAYVLVGTRVVWIGPGETPTRADYPDLDALYRALEQVD